MEDDVQGMNYDLKNKQIKISIYNKKKNTYGGLCIKYILELIVNFKI